MKRRSSLAYLLVLLLVGGYYYYFEVFQKKQQDTAAKEAKKVFHFQTDSVSALTLQSKGQPPVELQKGEQWQIVAPIKTEADRFSVHDLLGALSGLEAEREIVAAPSDLKPFGLIEPSLTVHFQLAGQGLGLLIGDKNPVGDGSYAKTADKPQVFLIAEGNRSALNRGLNELRRRQLFTFQLDEVAGVKVAWQDGNATALELASGEKNWTASANPQMKIKKSKVDNLVEQVHWLRAQNFLEDELNDLPSHGLEPPWVTVAVQLKSGESAELRLAKKNKNEQQITAMSSQLPSVVQVAASILDDLPKGLQSLQDRSLLGFKPEEVYEVAWNLGESQGHAVQSGEDKWGLKKGEKDPEPIKEPWLVRSLLWDIGDAEYQQKLDSVPPVVSNPYGRIELRNAGKILLLNLSWEKPPEEGRAALPVWVDRGGATGTEAVTVDAETLRRVAGDLERVGAAELKAPR